VSQEGSLLGNFNMRMKMINLECKNMQSRIVNQGGPTNPLQISGGKKPTRMTEFEDFTQTVSDDEDGAVSIS